MPENPNKWLIIILALGVFGILNTEMGVIGILPLIAERYDVSIAAAGLSVSLFALAIAVSGPITPLLFSRVNRKTTMLLVLAIFILGNAVSAATSNFTLLLIARVFPAVFHPVYVSLAFTAAASSVSKEEAPKAVSKIFIGVSAGMVLGVPVTSLIADAASLSIAMIFLAVVNTLAFLATLLFVPAMPVKEKTSYGAQVRVLKKSVIWLSIAAVIFMNGAVYGVYSYLAEYLETVADMAWNTISLVLFLYGAANIVGNFLAGKLLAAYAYKCAAIFPFALGAVYIVMFSAGQLGISMFFIIVTWGIVAGIGANINQYWITSAAPEAPEFANGLFLTSANLGTTFGATICGLFITGIGTPYVVFGGLLFLLLSSISVFLRSSSSLAKAM
ncbi:MULTISPECIES: MFS transporter [unclassified Paenibacillus]|uniref:MFS transporter n=1 Tax=unclassified Paenibacillus TaxID=185978 RepID=UPI00104CD13E|nr:MULTISPECIES: MFS transporter [unclassified Paenibacillus]NIK68627.1 putative MFS family arabinose efflux permease [Paenibacillus sp. BK720]TCM99085.1 putative MFS family arabinose efflux permease [Paenibacillus sp. BK033]